MLEDPWQAPLQEMFELSKSPQQAPSDPQEILIEFKNGSPTAIDGKKYSSAKLLRQLNEVGGMHGIGRVDMVESRFVGMKNRGVYETPGGTILHIAHRAIESITLNRGVINLKDSLMPRFAQLTYDGFWFSPEMEILLDMVKKTQEPVNGTVRLELYKGNCMVTGRKSPNSLYVEEIATMEEDHGAFDPKDAVGFIKLHALPLRINAGLKANSEN
jgi:argininosuccinate synthase